MHSGVSLPSKSGIVKLDHASKSSRGLLQRRRLGLIPKISDKASLGGDGLKHAFLANSHAMLLVVTGDHPEPQGPLTATCRHSADSHSL